MIHTEIGILWNKKLKLVDDIAELASIIVNLILLECEIVVVIESEDYIWRFHPDDNLDVLDFVIFLEKLSCKFNGLRGTVVHLEKHRNYVEAR